MGDIAEKRRAAYGQRVAARRATLETHARRASLLGNLKLLVVAVGVVTAWFALGTRSIDSLWLAPPALAFFVLLIVHDRVLRARARSSRSVTFYERGIARMEDHWIELEGPDGASGDERNYAEPGHPFAADLDLCAANDPQAPQRLAELLREMTRRTGMPTTLDECGVEAGLISTMAQEAAEQWTGKFNPRPIEASQFEELYQCALHDDAD